MEIVIAAACVVVSALFSGTRVAMFDLRRVDREQIARSQQPADKQVQARLQQPRRLLTTILIANESMKAVIAVMLLHVLAVQLTSLEEWAIGLVTIAVTIPAVVLLGDVTPATVARKSPLTWARRAMAPFSVFYFLVTPVRWVIGGVVELLLRPLGAVPKAQEGDLSEAEFRTLVEKGKAQGAVDAGELGLIHNVFDFSDKNVGQIMTKREQVFALSYDLPTARLLKEVAGRGFSRVPIYQRSLDNVRGILNAKDLLRPQLGQVGRTLGELLHEPLFVPRTTPVKRVFLTFKQKKVHMAIVVNEYGKVLGLVTMDDVLAQLFGTLRDEREPLQSAGRPGRGSGRTPPVGVPLVDAGAGESSGVPLVAAGEDVDDEDGSDEDGRGDAAQASQRSQALPSSHPSQASPLGGEGVVAESQGFSASSSGSMSVAMSGSMRSRKPSRVEVHEEVTPPATDLAELTPVGMPAADLAGEGSGPGDAATKPVEKAETQPTAPHRGGGS